MLAVKLGLCRTVLSSPFSHASRFIPKTFSTLNCLTCRLTQRCSAGQSLVIFNKPQTGFKFLSRGSGTVVSERTTPQVKRQVGIWLLGCCVLVYGAVTMGGYTRLTESGLSMVTWRFTYETHPSTEEEWLAEFKKYQEYPEFKLLKKDITLEDFKKIWKTEYLHRNFGRAVGIIFFVPAALFWLKGCFLPKMKKRIGFFGLLIVAQGLMGWYMVKSGLEDRFNEQADVPRVSQYRLAVHLGLALTLYTGLLWTALDLLSPTPKLSNIPTGLRKLRMLAHTSKGLIFLTALSGALVAGLDAGLVYNSFPKMGDSWIPSDILALKPVLKNFTENPTTVQFDHRIMGIATFTAIMATWLLSKRYNLTRRAKLAADMLALLAVTQVSLGISTLVHYVPTSLALFHQSGSVILLTLATSLSHELTLLKYIPK